MGRRQRKHASMAFGFYEVESWFSLGCEVEWGVVSPRIEVFWWEVEIEDLGFARHRESRMWVLVVRRLWTQYLAGLLVPFHGSAVLVLLLASDLSTPQTEDISVEPRRSGCTHDG